MHYHTVQRYINIDSKTCNYLFRIDQVKAEIEAFGGVDNVLVTRTTNASIGGYQVNQYTVTFVGSLVAGDVPQLQLVDVGENGCGAMTNATTGQEASSTLVDSFVPLYKVQNTEDLVYDAAAADVKAAIESLSGACTVDVTRSVRGNGYEWLVTFSDPDNDRLLQAMRPNALLLDNIADFVEPDAVIVPILSADLSTPKAGVPYYVRAAATNEVGTGSFRASSPTSLQPAAQTPSGPTHATMETLSDVGIVVQWEAPLSDGGEAISEYVVEWDTAATFDSAADGNPTGSAIIDASEQGSVADVQAVRVSIDDGLYLSGYFTLRYKGQRTHSIPFDASAGEVEAALESLCTVGDVAVTRSLGPANDGYTWLVTVVAVAEGEEAGNGQVSSTSTLQTVMSHKLDVDGENLLACIDATRTGCWSDPARTSVGIQTRKEMQRLLCLPGTDFTLSFMGQTTEALSSVANATEVEEALETLSAVGDVSVTGSCGVSGVSASYIYVTFENEAGDLPVLSSSVDGDFEEVVRGRVQVVVGQKPYAYTISDIAVAVVPWTVRIAAYNRVGYGEFALATHDSSSMVLGGVRAPTQPVNVAVEIVSARSVWVYWDASASDGGDSVTEYIVEVDVAEGFDSVCGDGPEIQTISVSATDSSHFGETFNLTMGGNQYHTCLEWNSSAFAIQQGFRDTGGALGSVVVTRGGDGTSVWDYGYAYSVTFVHNATDNALADVPEIEISSCETGTDGVVFNVETIKDGTEMGLSACQVDSLIPMLSESVLAINAEGDGDGSVTQGEFGLLVAGLSPGVSYRARVAAVSAAAKSPWAYIGYPGRPASFVSTAVPKISRNITVAPSTEEGTVHIGIGLPIGIDVNGVEGLPLQGFRVEMAQRVNEVQAVSIVFASDGNISDPQYPTQGSYSLSVGNATTWCLDWDAAADEVELALESLSTVDGVEVESLQPDINSTGNGSTSIYSSEQLLVSFTGPHLSNGDQDIMGYSLCTVLNAGAYVDVYTVTDGVSGLISPVVTLSTSANNANMTISGGYVISFGCRGELGLRLGEGNATSVYVTVDAGSRRIYSSSDLSHYINAGDLVAVDEVELVVAGDFTCEDSVAFDNVVASYPCSFVVESPHPYGASDVPAYGQSNALGSAHVTSGSTEVLTDWDLTAYLVPGDSIIVRDPTTREYHRSVVSSVDTTVVTLEDGYDGDTAVRAAAFYSPFALVPLDASAEELRDAIESLPSVASAEVSRKGPDEMFGFEWSVTLTSFDGSLSGAHTLQTSSTLGKALEVTNCGDAGNGTYVATGSMKNGRMRYKLVDQPSFIEYDATADNGQGLWTVATDGLTEPQATAVLGESNPARDSLVPPTGSASYWSTGCLVSIPSSTVEYLSGSISSDDSYAGVAASFDTLAKDISTEPGVLEVQAIELGASSDALDGTFMVDYADAGGFTASWDISAEDLEVRRAVGGSETFEICLGHKIATCVYNWQR